MSHINESHSIWMSHITYERVTSHKNEICHILVRRVTYEWVMANVNASLRIILVMFEKDMSHANESRHRFKQPCRIWMSHVTMFHTWMSHITYERHVTYKWVVSPMNFSCHIWMSSVLCSRVMSHMHKLFQECPYYWFAIMSNIILLCTIVWVGRIPKLYA